MKADKILSKTKRILTMKQRENKSITSIQYLNYRPITENSFRNKSLPRLNPRKNCIIDEDFETIIRNKNLYFNDFKNKILDNNKLLLEHKKNDQKITEKDSFPLRKSNVFKKHKNLLCNSSKIFLFQDKPIENTSNITFNNTVVKRCISNKKVVVFSKYDGINTIGGETNKKIVSISKKKENLFHEINFDSDKVLGLNFRFLNDFKVKLNIPKSNELIYCNSGELSHKDNLLSKYFYFDWEKNKRQYNGSKMAIRMIE